MNLSICVDEVSYGQVSVQTPLDLLCFSAVFDVSRVFAQQSVVGRAVCFLSLVCCAALRAEVERGSAADETINIPSTRKA